MVWNTSNSKIININVILMPYGQNHDINLVEKDRMKAKNIIESLINDYSNEINSF